MAVEGSSFAERSAAEAELRQILAAHPVGQTTTVWYNPAGRLPPTFESFGFLKAIVVRHWLALLGPGHVADVAFPGCCENERMFFRPSGKSSSRARNVFYASMALVTLALGAYYVLRPGCEMYLFFEPVTAKIVESGIAPMPNAEDYYVPCLELSYSVGGKDYRRLSDPLWFMVAPKDRIMTEVTKGEAREIASHYQVGEELEIRDDRRHPTSIVPERFLNWQFHPILVPPPLLLFIFARGAVSLRESAIPIGSGGIHSASGRRRAESSDLFLLYNCYAGLSVTSHSLALKTSALFALAPSRT